jgi:hypothetical protein
MATSSVLDQMRSACPLTGRASDPAFPDFLQNPNARNDLTMQMTSAVGVPYFRVEGVRPFEGGFSTMKLLERKYVLLKIVFATFALTPICNAQTQELSFDSAVEVARAHMQADKATIISGVMKFSEKDGAAFWPIYRQYERERSTLDDARIAVIKEYTEKYSTLSDDDAKSMAGRMFEYDARLAALKKTYFKKFNKVLPALTVTKFFQLDRRIDLTVDMQMESSIPPLTQAQYAAEEK